MPGWKKLVFGVYLCENTQCVLNDFGILIIREKGGVL